MTSKVHIHRLSTGVPGLDEVLGGGLPEFSFNLLAGPPGCGKTTLAHQIMFALATPARPALYFTVLGEPPMKMLRYQQQFGFFDQEAVNRSVRFVGLGDDAMTGDLERVLQRIVDEVTAHGPSFVFVDSFRSAALAVETRDSAHRPVQQLVQQLAMLMSSWQATTFLVGEYVDDTEANPVFTVADGLLWLRQNVQRNSMVRKLEVRKMRGQPTLPGLHRFRIGSDGIRVFPPAGMVRRSPADAESVPEGTRLRMGVPHLDDMLDGGLPPAYSLLVAGPSGSGKSILAAAFLAEGARNGEIGVLAAFEQHPNCSRNRVLADLIANGQVGLVDSRASDLSIDEVVMQIVGDIRRLKATRVVIDSLTGFELSLAPAFRDDFRESLLGLVTTLANEGVGVLMTCELEDRYTDLRFSPYGAAFLTDAIIVQRYIEVDSRLLRVMAVVKLRASAHSNELRLFTINGSGIRIGERLHGHEGLLGGRPTRMRVPAPELPFSAEAA